MKKVVLFLSFVFVAALGMNSYASTQVLENDVNITIVDMDDEKKECCKEGKTCDKCKEAKADAKTSTTSTECSKKKKSSCCSSKESTEGDKTESSATTEKK